ncbi:Sugar transferase involved in LPS biosynthesis (colanic, teichoic acid) [Siphonobacter aquaeclarae]|uniref:Sugar transferase involved in LPS biosynthesis (Colanic, teichoic acid) n=1 Tax=Siphonobacter aquaeclarae TaxID=563176 RepID=A0A1G9ND89_9BACT|nr:Sugar transferase involved in LPS biosynthesis (colanic, teichoic acid) [Siphonobacter aquaeclarae]
MDIFLASTSRQQFIHRLRSKRVKNGKVILFTGYDYFLQKLDLRNLLEKFQEVVLVPRFIDETYLIQEAISPLFHKYGDIHLVANPEYEERYRIIYEFAARNNKSIKIITVYDFCEKHLRKVYVPDSVHERNPRLGKLKPKGVFQQVSKSFIDVSLASVLLAVTSPLWLLSRIRIAQQSPGPTFYKQKRIGLNYQEFDCVKFRSMRLDAEAFGAQFSSKRDKRVFGYGAFMRATRIDELPQLLNIFRGDVSLVGPRPERRVFVESFEEMIPHYASRHVVKPGITGYAQVMYPYGTGVKDARHKLMYDLYYIRNWSLGLELRIVWKTVVTVLSFGGF